MTYSTARVPVAAGATVGVFDALDVAPAGMWKIRLFCNNPDVTLANNSDPEPERGYPLNNQVVMELDSEEVYIHNHDSNDTIIYALLSR